jgi:hypothetical protein
MSNIEFNGGDQPICCADQLRRNNSESYDSFLEELDSWRELSEGKVSYVQFNGIVYTTKKDWGFTSLSKVKFVLIAQGFSLPNVEIRS